MSSFPDRHDFDDETSDVQDEPIDFSLVYALHTFVANLEGQVCVLKGDSLELLDDSNSYWWLVKCIKTDEIGYIPAENVETPFERLARLNKSKNIQLATTMECDLGPAPSRKDRGNKAVIFPENFIEYIDDYGGEEYIEEPPPESIKKTGSLSRKFLTKIINKTSSISTASIDRIKAGTAALKRSALSPTATSPSELVNNSSGSLNSVSRQQISIGSVSSPSMLHDSSNSKQIFVLHVYAGNVDLKATFKSIPVNPKMTAHELLLAALRKFRVPLSSAESYYVSILHMDSQEKKIEGDEDIWTVLEDLKHKHLPGVGAHTNMVGLAVSAEGEVINLHVNDDKIIKVLINKEVCLADKDVFLVRVFMYDDSDATRGIRTYKTLGAHRADTVGALKQRAIQKFKLAIDSNYEFRLFTLSRGERFPCNDNVLIPQLLSTLGDEQDLVLDAQWVGDGDAPSSVQESNTARSGPSLMEDIKSLLDSKPGFLDVVPALGTSFSVPFMEDFPELGQLAADKSDDSAIITGIPSKSTKHCSTLVDLDTLRSQTAKMLKEEKERKQSIMSIESSTAAKDANSVAERKNSKASISNVSLSASSTTQPTQRPVAIEENSTEALLELEDATAFYHGVEKLNPATSAAFDELIRETGVVDSDLDDASSFTAPLGNFKLDTELSTHIGFTSSSSVIQERTNDSRYHSSTVGQDTEERLSTQKAQHQQQHHQQHHLQHQQQQQQQQQQQPQLQHPPISISSSHGASTGERASSVTSRGSTESGGRKDSFNPLSPTNQQSNAGFYASMRLSQYGNSNAPPAANNNARASNYTTSSRKPSVDVGDIDRRGSNADTERNNRTRPRSTFDTMEEYLEEHINGCQNMEKLGRLEEEINQIRLHSVVKGGNTSS